MSERSWEPQLVNTGDVSNPTPISQAILDGYAPGEELYIFSELPYFIESDLQQLRYLPYSSVFYEVTKRLLGDSMPDDVLRATADEAYSLDNFDFDEDGSLRITTLPSGIQVVGLSDGPTGAFKDMAMQPFARWMDYLLQREGRDLTILLCTSGDTGPAALNAFSGLSNTEIINMLPKKGVSDFQWSQMAELARKDGVHVLEVDGSFSDLNDMHLVANEGFELGAVNSVNIARIVAQIPYYFASYLKVVDQLGGDVGDPIDVTIPSGNFGNALSAIIARKMGLPIRNIIVATNENDTLVDLVNNGKFRLSKFHNTDSSAQDVTMPSNAWRYLALLFRNDPDKIAGVYTSLIEGGVADLSEFGIADETVRDGLLATSVSGSTRASIIRQTYFESDTSDRVIVDPHTANGIAAVEQLQVQDQSVPMLALETAKPFKFDKTIQRILGFAPERPARFRGLEERQKGVELTQIADTHDLFVYIGRNTRAVVKA